jgi:hypothetical protein
MNGSLIQPEWAWHMALDQLRLDTPKASFDTWVRDTSFVSFEDEVFTIGKPSDCQDVNVERWKSCLSLTLCLMRHQGNVLPLRAID